ncbi:MAG: copper-translocating P-type ATPase [Rubritepida sp.]|nr:copper-translocating P-type ATPase [Rubritepida sp.]
MSGQHQGHEHGHHREPGCGHQHEHGQHGHGAAPEADTSLVTDPVCGMKVDPTTSKHRVAYGGTTFHFCSAGCRTKFRADRRKYLKPKAEPPPTAPEKGTN